MKYQLIEFAQIKEAKKFTPAKDCVFKPSGRFQWLQKLAWAVLVKFSSTQRVEIVSERIVIDRDELLKNGKLLDAIDFQINEMYQLYNVRGARLLIGVEDFRRLASTPEVRHLMSFNVYLPMKNKRGNFIFGLEIQVVPWMQGILVMPPEGR